MPTVLGIKEGSIGADFSKVKKQDVWTDAKAFDLTYYVLGDSINDREDEIILASGIPPLGYPLRGCYCKKLTPTETNRVANPSTGTPVGLWEVKANFDDDYTPEDDQPPTSKPPVIRWHGETEEEILEKDVETGDPVQTDADEPILITTPFVLPVLEIKRWENYPFDPNTMLDYSHHVNSAEFWGAPVGSALMLPMEVDEETAEGIKYCVVTYKIKFKIKPDLDEPWKARVLHHGSKYRKNAGQPPVQCQDRYGNPTTFNLAEGGTKLAEGAEKVFKDFSRFQKANFNALSLDPPW